MGTGLELGLGIGFVASGLVTRQCVMEVAVSRLANANFTMLDHYDTFPLVTLKDYDMILEHSRRFVKFCKTSHGQQCLGLNQDPWHTTKAMLQRFS